MKFNENAQYRSFLVAVTLFATIFHSDKFDRITAIDIRGK
jgi:hypothetical protein